MLAVPQQTGVAEHNEDSAGKRSRSKKLRALDVAILTQYYWGLATKRVADELLQVFFDK